MKTNLGLDQDLINAVSQIVESSCSSKKMEKEELVGGQKKIDKNGNGKLDADDFKKLRKEETVEEEVEQIDELSKATLSSYVKKAKSDKNAELDQMDSAKINRDMPTFHQSRRNAHKRDVGIKLAKTKLTKEQVEEIEALAAKHGLGE